MIEAQGLTKDYGDKRAVDDLSFTVRPGLVTGFLGPNGSGKSTTMRLVLGLDRPNAGAVTVNGKRYREFAAPLHEVGALLEARSVHTGRSAYNHLLALAQTHGIPKSRVRELIDLVGLHDVARKRAGKFSLGMGQRLGIATALLGDPATLLLDEPVNGLDPEGIHWIRNLLKSLAAEGRTVFVSSHLMSEMALTADHLIVIGRGRLIADASVEEFIRRASGGVVQVRSPQATRLRELVLDDNATVTSSEPGPARDQRPDRPADRRARRGPRDRAARADAAAGLAGGRVHGADPRGRRVPGGRRRCGAERRGGGPMSDVTAPVAVPRLEQPGRLTQARVLRLGVDEAALAALDAMVAARRRGADDRAADPRRGHRRLALGSDEPPRPGRPVIRSTSRSRASASPSSPIAVLGVLVITGEYSTGMIRASFTAVPKRLPVLWAKAGVFAAVTFVLMLPSVLIAFFASQAILGGTTSCRPRSAIRASRAR